jgi:hypothetical protein
VRYTLCAIILAVALCFTVHKCKQAASDDGTRIYLDLRTGARSEDRPKMSSDELLRKIKRRVAATTEES